MNKMYINNSINNDESCNNIALSLDNKMQTINTKMN